MRRKYEQNAGPNGLWDDDHGAGVDEKVEHEAIPHRGSQISIFLVEAVTFVQICGFQAPVLHCADDRKAVAANCQQRRPYHMQNGAPHGAKTAAPQKLEKSKSRDQCAAKHSNSPKCRLGLPFAFSTFVRERWRLAMQKTAFKKILKLCVVAGLQLTTAER